MGQALKKLGVTLLKRHNRQHNFSYLNFNFKKYFTGTSLVVQWFKISPSDVGGVGLMKTPWRRAWQPSPLFLPGESHGQKSLVGYKSMGSQRMEEPGGLQSMESLRVGHD